MSELSSPTTKLGDHFGSLNKIVHDVAWLQTDVNVAEETIIRDSTESMEECRLAFDQYLHGIKKATVLKLNALNAHRANLSVLQEQLEEVLVNSISSNSLEGVDDFQSQLDAVSQAIQALAPLRLTEAKVLAALPSLGLPEENLAPASSEDGVEGADPSSPDAADPEANNAEGEQEQSYEEDFVSEGLNFLPDTPNAILTNGRRRVTLSLMAKEDRHTALANEVFSEGQHTWSLLIQGQPPHHMIGIAPSEASRTGYVYTDFGFFLSACDGTLYSGPPHSYRRHPYTDPIPPGSIVTVQIDFEARTMRFFLNGADLGIAYRALPPGPVHPAVCMHQGITPQWAEFVEPPEPAEEDGQTILPSPDEQ